MCLVLVKKGMSWDFDKKLLQDPAPIKNQIHFNVWQKPTQYYKVISLQLKEINLKNNQIQLIKLIDQ